MSLKERLNNELKNALKEKQKIKLETIRAIINAVKNYEINNKTELDDSGIEKIISTLVKQRKDSIEQFKKGGREDLVKQEQEELEILLTFLPEQLTEDEIKKIVQETINEMGKVTKKEFGKVMKAIMPKLQNRADGKIVSSWGDVIFMEVILGVCTLADAFPESEITISVYSVPGM
jgi:uncharacterized protein YqeY